MARVSYSVKSDRDRENQLQLARQSLSMNAAGWTQQLPVAIRDDSDAVVDIATCLCGYHVCPGGCAPAAAIGGPIAVAANAGRVLPIFRTEPRVPPGDEETWRWCDTDRDEDD